jgi:hypothetical protein
VAKDGRIYFTPSAQNQAYIEQLVRMGTYGKKRGDVVNYIVGKEIMRLIENKTLTRLTEEQERELTPEVED